MGACRLLPYTAVAAAVTLVLATVQALPFFSVPVIETAVLHVGTADFFVYIIEGVFTLPYLRTPLGPRLPPRRAWMHQIQG